MKIKFIIFIILFFSLAPTYSNAIVIVPTANLTITVNSSNDNNFFFKLNTYSGVFLNQSIDFNIQTQNQCNSFSVSADAFDGMKFNLTQDIISGMSIRDIYCVSDNPERVFSYTQNGVTFYPSPWENINCTFDNVSDRNPVLIVPGLTGTELKNSEELLWLDIARLIYTPGDEFLDQLSFNNNLIPINESIYITNVIKSKIGFDYTEGLVNEFKGQGYIEDESLFTFPYDWRYGITGGNNDGKSTPDLLKEKIQEIIAKTGSENVDVVAHSMGGLIVKKYVQNNYESHHIGKAVFVGVPNTGAVSAVKALVQGDDFGISLGPVGLNDKKMKEISRNMPAAYDLLPSKKYYDIAGSFISKINIGYGINEPVQEDIQYYNFGEYLSGYNLNYQAFLNAQKLHNDNFDDYDLRQNGIDLYSINGCKTGTMTNFLEVRSKDIFGKNYIDYANIKLETGDGTVPIISSTNLPIDQDKKYYATLSNHSKLLSAEGSRQKIVNLISGSSLPVSQNITQDIQSCQLNGKIIEVFSPIDIEVYDQSGNKLGLTNGNIINNIPGANFEMMGGHKFIYLPDGLNYSNKLLGTGIGTFTLKVKEIKNSQIIKTENFINIPVSLSTLGSIDISEQQSYIILQQSSGSQIQKISPTNIKNEDDYMSSIDIVPPEVSIKFSKENKDLSFYSDEDVNISDKDNRIILTDKSGNTTEIILKQKNRKILMKAEIKEVRYNGVLVDMKKNKMEFFWIYDRNGNLKFLSQHIQSYNGYNILAVYDGKKTSFIGKDSSGYIFKSSPGLILVNIKTAKGDLIWSY